MESAPEPLTRYSVTTKVRQVYNEKATGRWFVHFEGSWESLYFGMEEPAFKVGDDIKITFERAPCQACQITSQTTS